MVYSKIKYSIVLALVMLVFLPFNGKSQSNEQPDLSQYLFKVNFADPYLSLPNNPIPQKTITENAPDPSVHIETSDAIDHVMELHRNVIKSINNQGFRVQIYSGNNSGASQARTQFVSTHEQIDAYTVFDQPIFKVRVGNFKTHKEAEEFVKSLVYEYPNAFVVPDNIVEDKD